MNQLSKHDFGSIVNNLKDRKQFSDQMNRKSLSLNSF